MSRMDFPAVFTVTSWGYIVVDGVCTGLLESLYTGQESLRDRAFTMELLPTFARRSLVEIESLKAEAHVRYTDDRYDEVITLLRCPFAEELERYLYPECILKCFRSISRCREHQCWV